MVFLLFWKHLGAVALIQTQEEIPDPDAGMEGGGFTTPGRFPARRLQTEGGGYYARIWGRPSSAWGRKDSPKMIEFNRIH